MKEKLKRIITGILMCMLILTQLPANVFADETASNITGAGTEDDPYIVTTSDEFKNYLPQGYVKLGNDIKLEFYSVSVNKDSGIDLNGHVLDFSNAYGSRVVNVGSSKFSIKDSAPETTHNSQFVASDGTDLSGGILTGYKHDENGGGINTCFYLEGTEFTMSGGTFYNNTTISGGTCLTFDGSSHAEISYAGFYDNTSDYWSSCIWFSCSQSDDSIKLYNSKFIGNTAKSATVIDSNSTSTIIDSCVIKNNITANDGVVYGHGGAKITIKDTIITGNINTVDNVIWQPVKVAGVHMEGSGASLILDGKVDIAGNTVNGMERNVYSTYAINLGKGFVATSNVGITQLESLYDRYDSIAVRNAANFINCFSSDVSDGELYVKDGDINLRKTSHVHELGTKHEAVEATCVSAGTKEYYDCAGCDKKIDAEKNIIYNLVIPATGKHTSSDWITDKEATSTSEGSKHKECTVCKTVLETETIPKLDSVDPEPSNPEPSEPKPSDPKPSAPEPGTTDPGKLEKRNTDTLALNNDINSLSTSLLTDQEREIVKNGADAVVYAKLGTEVDKINLEKVNAAIGTLTLGKAYDISLWVQVGDNAARQITSTSAKINLSLKVDDSLINKDSNIKRTYKVIRIHDGVAAVLEGSFDAATQMFTFETDQFSTYALVYVDTAVSQEPSVTPPSTTPAPAAPAATPQPASASPVQSVASPKTGDTSPSLWMFAIIIIAGVGIVGYGLRRHKRNA